MKKQSLIVLALILGLTGCAQNEEKQGEDSMAQSEQSESQVSKLDPSLKKSLDDFKNEADEVYGQFRQIADETLSEDERDTLKTETLKDYHRLFDEGSGAYSELAGRISADDELSKSITELKDAMGASARQLEEQNKEDISIPDFDLDPMIEVMKDFEQNYFKSNSLR